MQIVDVSLQNLNHHELCGINAEAACRTLYLREKGKLKSNNAISLFVSVDTSERSISTAFMDIIHMFLVIFSAMCLAIACPT